MFGKNKTQKQEVVVPTGTDHMTKQFASMANKNEIAEVLKELFDVNKIHMITDLTSDQIMIATRIYMVAEMKNIPSWKEGLAIFCKLKLSRKRLSRRELLEAIKGSSKPEGIFSRMNPFNRNKDVM